MRSGFSSPAAAHVGRLLRESGRCGAPVLMGNWISGADYSAELNGRQYFKIPYAETGDLNICGPNAQVSMFAVVRIVNLKQSRAIAGMWSEGKGANDDTGTRQYALLMNMPAYGGPKAARRREHSSHHYEGGRKNRINGDPAGRTRERTGPVRSFNPRHSRSR